MSEADETRETICPITWETMKDPVVCAGDGHSYEREAMRQWLYKRQTSPITGAALSNCSLIPNHNLRKLIEDEKGARERSKASKMESLASRIYEARSGNMSVGSLLVCLRLSKELLGKQYEEVIKTSILAGLKRTYNHLSKVCVLKTGERGALETVFDLVDKTFQEDKNLVLELGYDASLVDDTLQILTDLLYRDIRATLPSDLVNFSRFGQLMKEEEWEQAAELFSQYQLIPRTPIPTCTKDIEEMSEGVRGEAARNLCCVFQSYVGDYLSNLFSTRCFCINTKDIACSNFHQRQQIVESLILKKHQAVENLIATHNKFKSVIGQHFGDNSNLILALKNAFKDKIHENIGPFETGDLLSNFCNRILTKPCIDSNCSGKSLIDAQVEIEVMLDKVVELFSHLSQKNTFAVPYRKQLSMRLMSKQHVLIKMERHMLRKLKLDAYFKLVKQGAYYMDHMGAMVSERAHKDLWGKPLKQIVFNKPFVLEAAIMCIMKRRDKLSHQELSAEIRIQLAASKPDPRIIKRCIESLIERKCLERVSKVHRLTYRYISPKGM